MRRLTQPADGPSPARRSHLEVNEWLLYMRVESVLESSLPYQDGRIAFRRAPVAAGAAGGGPA